MNQARELLKQVFGTVTVHATPKPHWVGELTVTPMASPKGVDPFSNLKLFHGAVAA